MASALESIRKALVSASTAEALTTLDIFCNSAVLVVDKDNTTGYMQFGGASVDANSGRVRSGDKLVINRDEVFNLKDIYVYGGTIGDAVDCFVVRSTSYGDLA